MDGREHSLRRWNCCADFWRRCVCRESFHVCREQDEAVADYRRAFQGPIGDRSVPVQCEEFIQIALAREPDRVQLHFCLGLINYHAKSDYAVAAEDLRQFLSKLKDGHFPRQAATAL